MTNEHGNKAKPSMTRRAAVIGAWVGGISCLLLLWWDYGIDISGIRIEAFLPYIPFGVPLYLFVVAVFFMSSKLVRRQIIGIEDRVKTRTMLQFLAILLISCPITVLVALAMEWEDPTVFAVIAACAALGALGFWLVADWIRSWRQSGFKHTLFRTIGAACAVLGLGLALALRITPRDPLYSLCIIIPLLAFVTIGTVVDEIIVMTKEQEPPQDVEGNIQEVGSIVQRGPATYDQLKSLRGKYALILIGIVVFSFLLSGPAQLAIQYSRNVFLPAIAIGILSALLCAIVTGIYAQKVGIPRPVTPALGALLPFVPWIGLFIVVGYTPNHLKESEPGEDSLFVARGWMVGLVVGVCVGLLPIIVMRVLGLLNPNYIGQLFFGPPIGAYIPGLPIACGWPILAMIGLGVLVPPISMWFGFHRSRVRRWWKLLLVFIVLLQCAFPSVWLVLMGPAAIQVYKQFVGGGY